MKIPKYTLRMIVQYNFLIEMSSDIDGSFTSLPEILMITIIKLFSNDGNLNAIIFS